MRSFPSMLARLVLGVALFASAPTAALAGNRTGPVPAASVSHVAPKPAGTPMHAPTPSVSRVAPSITAPRAATSAVPVRTPPTARAPARHPSASSATTAARAAVLNAQAPAPAERDALVQQGRAIVAKQVDRVQQMLPTSGYASLEDLANAMSAMGPARARVVDLVKDERNFEFVMNRTEKARTGIAAAGFLNQYETGTSSGWYSPGFRIAAEASFLGMKPDDYEKLSPRVRPKYGYLRPSSASGLTQEDPATQYGTDTFVFKPTAVKDNVTFWPWDSLGSPAAVGRPKNWDEAFVPWSHRMLLAPSLAVDGNELTRSDLFPPGFQAHYKEISYVELQFWRPLGLEDVERFEFGGTPPTGAFLAALRANGVKIFQKGQTTEWRGDAPAAASSALPSVLHIAPLVKAPTVTPPAGAP